MSDVSATGSSAPHNAGAQGAQEAPGAPSGESSSESEFTGSSTIQSLEELKSKAPDLYNKWMEGVASTIVNEMKDHQARLKKLMREAEAQSQGRK